MTANDRKIIKKIEEAIQYSLQPTVRSNFLIINRSANDLAELAEIAANDLDLKVSMFNLDRQGPYQSFPSRLKKQIASEKFPRAMGLFSYPKDDVNNVDQRETPARVELVGLVKKVPMGYMHSPGADYDMFLRGPVQCNYKVMIERSKKMLEILKGVKSLHVTAPAGTSLDVKIPSDVVFETDCIAVPPDTYGNPGTMKNLPIGEVCALRRKEITCIPGRNFEYPVKLKGNGKIVCDVRADHIEKLIDPCKPVEVNFKNGVLTSYHSEDKAFTPMFNEWEQRKLEYGLPVILEEVGIGINEKARKTGKMVEVEKRKGTIHFAPGHHRSHSDLVVDEPTATAIYANGTERTFLEDGDLILD